MVTSRIAAFGLVLLLLCIGFGVNAQASETCRTPTPQSLINWYNTTHPGKPLHYSQQNSAIYHPISIFKTDSPRLHWIGLAWLSPVWGALFAVNCDGKSLSAVSKGAVGKISAGPVLPALGQTIMFEYVDKETTDCVHDSIAIVAFKDGKIISLWKHGYKQGMNVADAKVLPGSFITHNYAMTFSNDRQTLRVSGLVQDYPYRKDGSQSPEPTSTKTLPEETYHWDTKTLRFLPEKTYEQTKPCVNADWPSVK
ncbi:MAG: hypothetical protein ACRESE_08285 [Gammaproteobacteria bacterium]